MNQVKIEKLVFGGRGLGYIDNKPIFLLNSLPNEEVVFKYTKNNKYFSEGFATDILCPSPYRIAPKEHHYLSCSPWQIINWGKEQELKKETASETYKKIGKFDFPSLEIISDDHDFNYRNKIEYNFIINNGSISFAIFLPKSNIKEPIDICELAKPEINYAANNILAWINKNNIPEKDLNKIILRCSQKGEVIAGLFLNSKLQFDFYPDLNDRLAGFDIYYIDLNNNISIYKSGKDYLEEEFFGIKITYGLFSFFQINTNIFKKALEDISGFIDGEDIIDFYSGVGAIGLGLRKYCKKLFLVESNLEASVYAKANVNLNNFTNIKIFPLPSEKAIHLISQDKTIIFDPPRAGLNSKIIEKIMLEKPKRIIYLSCNLSTHARDVKLLSEAYEIKLLKLYNFFPHTPHI